MRHKIKIQGMPEPLEATAEQSFYVRKRLRKQVFTEPHFVEAKDIEKGNYAGWVIDKPTASDNNSLAFWYMIGRYIGDGWTNNSKRKSKIIGKRGSRINSFNYKVIICTSTDDADNLQSAIKKAGYHATPAPEKSIVKFIISEKKLFEFVSEFGKYAYGKFLPQRCFDLSHEKQKALFEGWKDADGYEKCGRVSVTTVSRQLAFDMARVARNAYKIPVSINKAKANRECIIEGRKVSEREQFRVRFSHTQRYGFYENGYVWCLVKLIQAL